MHPIQGKDGELYAGELIEELSVLDDGDDDSKRMVGASPIFLRALEQLKSAAQYDAPVLLRGETGTGKELAANFIHEQSARREAPFFTLDCTVLTEPLFESEVFGHERGAFTGSVGQRKGLFELADDGTLFLDEVGEMSPNTQSKMLRVLESGEFRRVGGHEIQRSSARIICATNRDLKTADWFRKDLYYRVACLSIELPSLRERLEDLPPLADAVLTRITRSTGHDYRLTHGALKLLQRYHFPGNIRELRNILWAAATRCRNGRIEADDIELQPGAVSQEHTTPVKQQDEQLISATDITRPATLHSSLQDVEAQLIADLLDKFNGNRRKVASQLGICERTLYRKLKHYELN
jgi:DNA-binding NtrC family response regulator